VNPDLFLPDLWKLDPLREEKVLWESFLLDSYILAGIGTRFSWKGTAKGHVKTVVRKEIFFWFLFWGNLGLGPWWLDFLVSKLILAFLFREIVHFRSLCFQ